MTTATWVLLQYGEHQTRPEDLGFLPMFLDPNDPRPAKEQLHENYQHGGGWHSMPGFSIGDDLELCYPGDPPMQPDSCHADTRHKGARVSAQLGRDHEA
jgi:hypothetical protein